MPVARKTRQPRRTQTAQLLATQNQILDYLRQDVEEWRKTGERNDRQQRATLLALTAISKSLAAIDASQARQIEIAPRHPRHHHACARAEQPCHAATRCQWRDALTIQRFYPLFLTLYHPDVLRVFFLMLSKMVSV